MDGVRDDGDYSASQGASASKRIKLETLSVPVNLTDLKAVMRKHKIIVKKWRDIGLELLKNDGELEIIKINNPGNIEACCTEMFKQWLESDLHASWNKIITTLQKIELNVAAKYIEDNLPTTGSSFHDGGKSLPMHKSSCTPEAAATTATTLPYASTHHEIFNKKPEMFDLTKIVIPKIMTKWEYVAEALRYDLATIMAIKEKQREDPKQCCREFFIDWLMTKNGAKAGPKVWSTLLDALKEVNEISDDITEDIIEKIKQLKL